MRTGKTESNQTYRVRTRGDSDTHIYTEAKEERERDK